MRKKEKLAIITKGLGTVHTQRISKKIWSLINSVTAKNNKSNNITEVL